MQVKKKKKKTPKPETASTQLKRLAGKVENKILIILYLSFLP